MFDWFINNLHTRKGAYHLILGGIFLLEGVFAYRIQAMYGALLEEFGLGQAQLPIPMTPWALPLGAIGLFIIQVAIFFAFLALGFAYATHRQYALEALIARITRLAKTAGISQQDTATQAEVKKAREDSTWMMRGLIANDVAAGLYIVIADSHLTWTSLKLDIGHDLLMVVAMIGWTVVVILPFKAGPFTLALAESLVAEQKETFAIRGQSALLDLQETAMTVIMRGKQKLTHEQAMQIVLQTGKHATGEGESEAVQSFLNRLQEVQAVFETPAQPQKVLIQPEPLPSSPPTSPAPGHPVANGGHSLQEFSNPAVPTELTAEDLAGILHVPVAEAAALMQEQPQSMEEVAAYRNGAGVLVTTLKEAARVGSLRSQRQPAIQVKPAAALGRSGEQQDTLQQAVGILTLTPDISDDDLAAALNLKKPASARWWRLRVQEFLQQTMPAAPVAPAAGNGGNAASSRPFRLWFFRSKSASAPQGVNQDAINQRRAAVFDEDDELE